MLLPALGKARARARAASCTSNLKQCTTAAILYSGDNKDLLIINGPKWLNQKFGASMGGWNGILVEEGYFKYRDNVLACPTMTSIDPNMFWGYGTHTCEKAYFDPGRIPYKESIITYTTATPGAFVWSTGKEDCIHMYFASNKIQSPSTCYYICDSGDSQSINEYGRTMLLWGWGGLLMKARHSGKVNLSFADGHVGSHTPQEIVNMTNPANNPDYQKTNGMYFAISGVVGAKLYTPQ